MATWQDLTQLRGYFESSPLSIALDGDGAFSRISWEANTPDRTKASVYTALSFDGGQTYTNWSECINGGSLPDVDQSVPLGSALLLFRIHLETLNEQALPRFESLRFELEPALVLDNRGVAACTPEVWITKKGNGDFALINTSNGNTAFAFTDLIDGETVYVNSEREQIETSLAATYRYSNFNDRYLKLPVGLNVFKVVGDADLQFRYQFKLTQ